MKRAFLIFLVTLPVILSACAASSAQSSPPAVVETSPTAMPSPTLAIAMAVTDTPQPISTQTSAVETSTLLPVLTETPIPQVIVVALPTSTDSINTLPDHPSPAAYAVTLNDNGGTFNLRVGDNILLDLGVEMYDWNVGIDNPSALNRRIGDAQIIFDALSSGTANLTAVGNPKCINSTPPCMMPSILFEITIIVQ